MANNFNQLPIRLDSAMGSTYQNSSPPNNLSLYPTMVYWFNPLNVGDVFTITDAGAVNVLLQGRCEVANQSQVFAIPNGTKWFDFKLTALSTGVIYIWFKN